MEKETTAQIKSQCNGFAIILGILAALFRLANVLVLTAQIICCVLLGALIFAIIFAFYRSLDKLKQATPDKKAVRSKKDTAKIILVPLVTILASILLSNQIIDSLLWGLTVYSLLWGILKKYSI